jgi:hypothetical protein
MPETKRWIITTSDERPLKEVSDELAKAGFVVGDVMDAIGSITGTADDETAGKARSIQGVTDVSPDTPIDIGPPGSSETW